MEIIVIMPQLQWKLKKSVIWKKGRSNYILLLERKYWFSLRASLRKNENAALRSLKDYLHAHFKKNVSEAEAANHVKRPYTHETNQYLDQGINFVPYWGNYKFLCWQCNEYKFKDE